MRCPAAALALALSSPLALAQVTNYESFKTQQFFQFADATPSGPSNFYFYSRIVGNFLSSYLTTASVETPTSEILPLPFDGATYIAFGVASSQAELDTRFPAGTYTFRVSGGSLGAQSGAQAEPANLFADTIPRVVNYDALQTLDPTRDFTVQINSYTPAASINVPAVFVTVRRYSDNATVFVDAFDTPRVFSTIPAGVLQTGTLYLLTVYFSPRVYTDSTAFGGCIAGAAFDSATDMYFTPVAGCPCAADFDGSGGTPDATDIDAFFTAWLSGDATADVDCSGGTPDATDIDEFFTQWLTGGC